VPLEPKPAWSTVGRYTNALCFADQQCSGGEPLATTTHPDQHHALIVPGGQGKGPVLYAGNDGGIYRQQPDAPDGAFSNQRWGNGANRGLGTTIAFGGGIANDGTIYLGMQDNGSGVIDPATGRFNAAYGGDGSYIAVDPAKSKTAYGTTQYGGMYVTTDGGRSWSTGIAPTLTGAPFFTPFTMDPLDARHLVAGAREIVETTKGSSTQTADWKVVFDLGTPNDPAVKNPNGNHFVASALAVRGKAIYAPFCGICDPVLYDGTFRSGMATNVQANGTVGGWHKTKAAGLPQRLILGVAMDPINPAVVYVAVAGYASRWSPVTGLRTGDGHVFRSDDAGETFRNISGDLPDIPADDILVRGGQLIVATHYGVYISADFEGSHWEPLGGNLPVAPVSDLSMTSDGTRLLAATIGRGGWVYDFRTVPPLPPVERPAPPQPPNNRPTNPRPPKGPAAKLALRFSRPGGAARRFRPGPGAKRIVLLVRTRTLRGTVRRVSGFIYALKKNGKPGILIGRTTSAVTVRKSQSLRLLLRKRLLPGRYFLVLTGRNPDGRSARATAILRFR
jgi:hypothetical protein